ncbi:MAG TPA: hypothetical protein HPP87_05490 [Planctomycetes bacterium]|nr:hypothetical protein [Planctomycetota bacterium]
MVLVILWGGVFVALAGAHIFLAIPQRKESALLEKQLLEKRLKYDISKAADSEQVRARLNEKVNSMNEQLSRFAAEVDELDDLWFSVSRIAGEVGVDSFQIRGIDDESYSSIPNCYDIGTASAEVSFLGSFSKLAKFINKLERHKPVVFIGDFTISQARKEASVPAAKLVLSVFVRIPEADKAAGTVPEASASGAVGII